MKIKNGFIINPTKELTNKYYISPFSSIESYKNRMIENENIINAKKYFSEKFENYCLTLNGRQAIEVVLRCFSLQKEDVITIFTSSGNNYVSSCVTKEIEKFCQWSRKIEKKSKIIFLIHEFGYVTNNNYKQYKLPIIEDCAYSFFSQNESNNIGKIGDYVIYSLPKMFPIQFGGIISTHNMIYECCLSIYEENYIYSCIGREINKESLIIKRRNRNYQYLKNKLSKIGFNPLWELKEKEVPGVFLFEINDKRIDLENFKQFMNFNGVESTIYYGTRSYFIPVHQNLNLKDLNFFYSLIISYINENQ